MLFKLFPFIFLASHGYELKQVIVLSRHNIRTPLSTTLNTYTPKQWPKFNEETGYLTSKGHVLERSMGKYFFDWMIREQLLVNSILEDQVFVYANNQERTVGTAKSFVEGAFGDGVEVFYKNITDPDPVFDSVIRNDTEKFKETVLNAMQAKINSVDLNDTYLSLDSIADFGSSSYCKNYNICKISEANTNVKIEANVKCFENLPKSLVISNSLVDAFLMAYYDGKPSEDIAWGQIKTIEQWKDFSTVIKVYQDVCYKIKYSDKHIAYNLLKYMSDIFENGKKKFYLLVGHDTNIVSLLSALGFKDYSLDGQFEETPIGGKVVFEKWHDGATARDLLRVRYVYQSAAQLRDGAEVSLLDPPYSALLEIQNCAVDENGYCPWTDFISILNDV